MDEKVATREELRMARASGMAEARAELLSWVKSQRAKPWAESGSFASRMTGEEGYDAALEELEYRLEHA